MKKIVFFIILLCVTVSLAAAGLGLHLYHYAHEPAGTDNEPVDVTIPAGESFDRLAGRLVEKGILRETLRFKLLARLRGDDKYLKAGEYRLSDGMTPLQLLDMLVRGEVFLHVLTIPEGYTLSQIAEAADNLELTDKTAFLAVATDPATAAAFDIPGQTLEGFLFPDTYHFAKGLSPRSIITTMVERFRQQFVPAWHHRAAQLGMTVYQVVILASMIEKETGAPFERPLISSVFHNRLEKGMRLASDPTVIYGIKDFDGNITRKHLRTPTPYNTYVIKGLPVGPIANPGHAAIKAALYPAQSDYLYFVAKKDGTHHFSKSIQEHNRAVRKYQLTRKR